MIHACGLLGCEGRSRGLHSRLLREKVVRLPDSYLIGGLARALTERNRKARFRVAEYYNRCRQSTETSISIAFLRRRTLFDTVHLLHYSSLQGGRKPLKQSQAGGSTSDRAGRYCPQS